MSTSVDNQLAVQNRRAQFGVYSGDTLIGRSELESGDPLGVAFGRFIPDTEYQRIQADVGAELLRQGNLSVRTIAGLVLHAASVVHIADHSAECGLEGSEVSVLGIPAAAYTTFSRACRVLMNGILETDNKYFVRPPASRAQLVPSIVLITNVRSCLIEEVNYGSVFGRALCTLDQAAKGQS